MKNLIKTLNTVAHNMTMKRLINTHIRRKYRVFADVNKGDSSGNGVLDPVLSRILDEVLSCDDETNSENINACLSRIISIADAEVYAEPLL